MPTYRLSVFNQESDHPVSEQLVEEPDLLFELKSLRAQYPAIDYEIVHEQIKRGPIMKSAFKVSGWDSMKKCRFGQEFKTLSEVIQFVEQFLTLAETLRGGFITISIVMYASKQEAE